MLYIYIVKVVCQFRPHGYLFEREAILESLLHQKRESKKTVENSDESIIVTDARKMKEYEKQRKKQEVN